MRVAERLIKFHRSLVSSRELTQFPVLVSERKAEAEEKNAELLKYLVVDPSQRLTYKEPANAVLTRLPHCLPQYAPKHFRLCAGLQMA